MIIGWWVSDPALEARVARGEVLLDPGCTSLGWNRHCTKCGYSVHVPKHWVRWPEVAIELATTPVRTFLVRLHRVRSANRGNRATGE